MTRQLLAIGALLTFSASAAFGQAYGNYNYTSAGLPRYAKEYAESAERLYQADVGRQEAVRAYYQTQRRVERNLSVSLGLTDAKNRLSAAIDRFDKSRSEALAKLLE